jgi:hypothetical protein
VTLPSGEIPLDELYLIEGEHHTDGRVILLFAFQARRFELFHQRLNQRFALSSLHLGGRRRPSWRFPTSTRYEEYVTEASLDASKSGFLSPSSAPFYLLSSWLVVESPRQNNHLVSNLPHNTIDSGGRLSSSFDVKLVTAA